MDLTNAQKRDERFYPPDAVIVFNQKVRDAEPGAKGKLAGILKSSVLVEVGGKFVTVSNRLLDRITVCQAREISVAKATGCISRPIASWRPAGASPTVNSSP